MGCPISPKKCDVILEWSLTVEGMNKFVFALQTAIIFLSLL